MANFKTLVAVYTHENALPDNEFKVWNIKANLDLSMAHYHLGAYQEAVHCLRYIISDTETDIPTRNDAFYWMSLNSIRMQDYGRAIEQLETIDDHDEDFTSDKTIALTLAHILKSRGDDSQLRKQLTVVNDLLAIFTGYDSDDDIVENNSTWTDNMFTNLQLRLAQCLCLSNFKHAKKIFSSIWHTLTHDYGLVLWEGNDLLFELLHACIDKLLKMNAEIMVLNFNKINLESKFDTHEVEDLIKLITGSQQVKCLNLPNGELLKAIMQQHLFKQQERLTDCTLHCHEAVERPLKQRRLC